MWELGFKNGATVLKNDVCKFSCEHNRTNE